jgi:hypothetical protein
LEVAKGGQAAHLPGRGAELAGPGVVDLGGVERPGIFPLVRSSDDEHPAVGQSHRIVFVSMYCNRTRTELNTTA